MAMREKNNFAHIQAAYFYEALCNASPLFRGLKPSRAQSFRKEPYDLFDEDRKVREEEEQRAQYDRIRDKVAAFAKAFNEKRNSKNREVDVDAGSVP